MFFVLIYHFVIFVRLRITDVTERHPREAVKVGRSSNLVYTIWAVFGGFILHFLLSNYLTVLLRPRYEKPVETAADIITRDVTPFYFPGGDIWKQFFADSPDPHYQEIAKRLHIAKDYDEFDSMLRKVTSTGLYAQIGVLPSQRVVKVEEYKNWYRSAEAIAGTFPYGMHLLNKKWPLKKVLVHLRISIHKDS